MNQSRQLLSPAYRRSFTSCIQDIGSCLHWLLFFFAFGYFSDPPYDGASGNTHDLLFSLLFHPIFGSQLFLILSRLIPLVEQSLASKGGIPAQGYGEAHLRASLCSHPSIFKSDQGCRQGRATDFGPSLR